MTVPVYPDAHVHAPAVEPVSMPVPVQTIPKEKKTLYEQRTQVPYTLIIEQRTLQVLSTNKFQE